MEEGTWTNIGRVGTGRADAASPRCVGRSAALHPRHRLLLRLVRRVAENVGGSAADELDADVLVGGRVGLHLPRGPAHVVGAPLDAAAGAGDDDGHVCEADALDGAAGGPPFAAGGIAGLGKRGSDFQETGKKVSPVDRTRKSKLYNALIGAHEQLRDLVARHTFDVDIIDSYKNICIAGIC